MMACQNPRWALPTWWSSVVNCASTYCTTLQCTMEPFSQVGRVPGATSLLVLEEGSYRLMSLGLACGWDRTVSLMGIYQTQHKVLIQENVFIFQVYSVFQFFFLLQTQSAWNGSVSRNWANRITRYRDTITEDSSALINGALEGPPSENSKVSQRNVYMLMYVRVCQRQAV